MLVKKALAISLLVSVGATAAEPTYTYDCQAVNSAGLSKNQNNGGWDVARFNSNEMKLSLVHQDLVPSEENQPLSKVIVGDSEYSFRCDLRNFSLTYNCLDIIGSGYVVVNPAQNKATYTQSYPPIAGFLEASLMVTLYECTESVALR